MATLLVTFAGGRGHLLPMLPLARALSSAGHRLLLAGQGDAVEDHGIFDDVRRLPPVPGRATGSGPRDTGTLAVQGLAHELAVVGRWYAGTLARHTAGGIAALIAEVRPDGVVCDEMDFGSMVAAEAAGLPVVVVAVIASGALTRAPYVAGPLAALREAHGLPADPDLFRRYGDLLVSPFPAGLRDSEVPLPARAVLARPEASAAPTAVHPAAAWLRDGPRPSVLVTLGTVFNTESGDLFSRLVDGLGGLGRRVLITVGPDLDPASIGAGDLSDDVRVERWVPQDQVLPHVDAVVHHAGSGTTLAALAHGLPSVVIAIGADQELNARRLVALDAATALDPLTVTPAEIRAAVLAALEGAARPGAEALTLEIAAMPEAAAAVPLVEALVRS